MGDPFDRVGVVVHPRRELTGALGTVGDWTSANGIDLVQVPTPNLDREVAPRGDAADCDLVIALGGDGTTLAALHAAAPVDRPVLGVACGSLGALTATSADRLEDALDRVARGDWTPRALPAVVATHDDGRLEALNDVVLVRAGAGQVMIEIDVAGETFVRYAGDGLIAATPLGSTAYTLASGGPMVAPGGAGMVLTPLAPHGGVCPPLVTGPDTPVEVLLDPGHGGARVEIDGQVRFEAPAHDLVRFALSYEEGFGELVSLGEQESMIAGLRRRRLLLDSPRLLARDDRGAPASSRPA